MPPSDIDTQVLRIGAALRDRVDELAHRIAPDQGRVAFYRETKVITADELIRSSADNARFISALCRRGSPSTPRPRYEHRFTARGCRGSAARGHGGLLHVIHHIWDVMIEIARTTKSAARSATSPQADWQAQDAYTDAMTSAYGQQALQQALDAEAERAAMTEALFNGHIFDDRTVWDIAQLLGIPHQIMWSSLRRHPAVGKQALPGMSAKLRSVGHLHCVATITPTSRLASRTCQRNPAAQHCSDCSAGWRPPRSA